jgi:Spy/CpxP family protein refolding chaperone
MINTKLLKGALAAAAAFIAVTPALAHNDRSHTHNHYYGKHYKYVPYAWKHKKHHQKHYSWNKRPHRYLGWGYNRYDRGPSWR